MYLLLYFGYLLPHSAGRRTSTLATPVGRISKDLPVNLFWASTCIKESLQSFKTVLDGAFLAEVSPSGALSPTCRYWRVVAHLLRHVTVLSIQHNVFKRLALNSRLSADGTNGRIKAYKHRVERLGDPANRRRVVRHRKCRHK